MNAEERFNALMDDFLREKKLETVGQIATTSSYMEDFLFRSEVFTYLTRSAKDVTFDVEGEPVLPRHERDFYDVCRKSRYQIPYRAAQSETLKFYASGTTHKDSVVLNRMLQERIEQGQAESAQKPKIFIIGNGKDPYIVRDLLRAVQGQFPDPTPDEYRIFYEKRDTYSSIQDVQKLSTPLRDGYDRNITLPHEGYSFLIFPFGKDDHALTIAAAVDNVTKKINRLAIINSHGNQPYDEYQTVLDPLTTLAGENSFGVLATTSDSAALAGLGGVNGSSTVSDL